jgi:hypothetical protein
MPLKGSFVVSFISATHRRRFFLGKLKSPVQNDKDRELRYGLCDKDAAIDDEIWILASGKVPFILRPIYSTSKTCSVQ